MIAQMQQRKTRHSYRLGGMMGLLWPMRDSPMARANGAPMGFTKLRVNRDSWQDQLGEWQSSIDYELIRGK